MNWKQWRDFWVGGDSHSVLELLMVATLPSLRQKENATDYFNWKKSFCCFVNTSRLRIQMHGRFTLGGWVVYTMQSSLQIPVYLTSARIVHYYQTGQIISMELIFLCWSWVIPLTPWQHGWWSLTQIVATYQEAKKVQLPCQSSTSGHWKWKGEMAFIVETVRWCCGLSSYICNCLLRSAQHLWAVHWQLQFRCMINKVIVNKDNWNG